MKNIISKITILLVLAMLTGCAVPPSNIDYVSNPMNLNFVKTRQHVKISSCKSIYNKACTKEQIALAEVIRQRVLTLFKKYGDQYTVVDRWQDADVITEFSLNYLGRSKKTAYKNAIPVDTMFSLVKKPGEAISKELTQNIIGRSARSGAASSMAGILFMVYDLGAFAVDGIHAIGHLYANYTIDIMDKTPMKNGGKMQRFRTHVAATIDLEGNDRAANVAKFIPIYINPLLPVFFNDQVCKTVLVE